MVKEFELSKAYNSGYVAGVQNMLKKINKEEVAIIHVERLTELLEIETKWLRYLADKEEE